MSEKNRVIVYVDANNVEIGRKTITRGRPPAEAVVNDKGELVVKGVKVGDKIVTARMFGLMKPPTYYVTMKDGVEVSREQKGRGPAKIGYVKGQDGNWYGAPVEKPKAEKKATTPATVATPVVAAPAPVATPVVAAPAVTVEASPVTEHVETKAEATTKDDDFLVDDDNADDESHATASHADDDDAGEADDSDDDAHAVLGNPSNKIADEDEPM